MTEEARMQLVKAPDPILAELWEVKRQINKESGYQIDKLAQMAHESARHFLEKWGQTPFSCEK